MRPDTPLDRLDRARRGVVLLIDDDELLREALSDLLAQQGYHVETCEDATDGLMRLRAGLSPHVIMLDLRLPGMDGWEFRLIQKSHPTWSEIPLIAISGDASPKAAAIDAELFLGKPLNQRAVLDAVGSMVRLAQKRADHDQQADVDRLRNMGALASGISDQLLPSIGALLDDLKLAEDEAADLQKRLSGQDSSRLVSVRRRVESAQRHAERARGILGGVSLFCQMALHSYRGRRRVLVAHGEPRLSALLREALADDHEVLLVHSGREALRALIEDNFDVFLCELVLPDIHGIEIYEQLRGDRPEQAQRMVFLTAAEALDERERLFFARHRPWQLRAPFRAGEVRELIEAQWRSFH